MTKPDEASRLQYDITRLPADALVLEAFPLLADNPVFAEYGAGANDPYLRLAIYYADKESVYRDLPLDIKKDQCLTAAGVPADSPRRAGIRAWADGPVVAMVTAYVRLQQSLEFALWLHGTESAWQTIEKLSSPIEDDIPPTIRFYDEDDDYIDEKREKIDKNTAYLANKISFYGKALIKTLLRKSGGGAQEMDEAKIQAAYKARRDNLDAMFLQVPKLVALRNQLFMGDVELAASAARSLQKKTPVAERRSEGRSFIPKTA